ncbi:MAG: hypothetical protein JOY82_09830 [Streptosporangiaceae bacterium]|nr:hypothetical protein [Streptosporangiaceae bacterium]MBV9854809.1 hypothetical protein [Streptosporangiaceae bacterium]
MQTATRPVAPLWTALRNQLRGTRDAHSARRSLERDLASYTSPADLNDLGAILDRYSDEETADIRRILAAQRR